MQMASSGKDNGAFYGVLKFAHVTRPVVVSELTHRSLGDCGCRTVQTPAALRQEVSHQRRNVVAAFAQGRDLNRKNT